MGVLFVSVSSDPPNCELHKQLHSMPVIPSNHDNKRNKGCHIVACCPMYENEHMSPPNFPAGSCSSFPVRASVCFQPVSPCDVRLPPLLSRQPQLPVKIPPPVCSWATWLFHKGYWNNSAPKKEMTVCSKEPQHCTGGLV